MDSEISSKRVLLVDDNQDVLHSTSRCLLRAGFSVITCEDGDEAIAALEGVPFDVVVSDVQMPNLNGLSLVDWIATNRPGLRVILMTAFGSSDLYRSSMKMGASYYLEKPIDPKLLVSILETAADRGLSNEDLIAACIEAEKKEGSGEVVAKAGDKIGRIFFSDGKVAWAAVSNKPGIFWETFCEKTMLERAEIESMVRALNKKDNIVDQLMDQGKVSDGLMTDILMACIVECLLEISKWCNAQVIHLPVKRSFGGSISLPLTDVMFALNRHHSLQN